MNSLWSYFSFLSGGSVPILILSSLDEGSGGDAFLDWMCFLREKNCRGGDICKEFDALKTIYQESHVGVLNLEVVGVPRTSTHWMGPNTTPSCDSYKRF